jgi:hypothetical protein
VEEITYDEELFKEKLQEVQSKYYSLFVPEYFEHRLVRNLPIFDLDL